MPKMSRTPCATEGLDQGFRGCHSLFSSRHAVISACMAFWEGPALRGKSTTLLPGKQNAEISVYARCALPTEAAAAGHHLRRTLQRRHMQMIALGGVIGAGLFVGSGVVIKAAGPGCVVSFALTGTLVVLVMRMLGEMAAAYPAIGGFYEYNRLALGELAGFLTGWMYWYFWVIVVALEAVAGARLLSFWCSGPSQWVFTLASSCSSRCSICFPCAPGARPSTGSHRSKSLAIVVFLCVGFACILGIWPGVGGGVAESHRHGGFMPHGIGARAQGAVAATGFYFGSEIVTVAAAESAAPERAVARATQSVISRVLVFYRGLDLRRGDALAVERSRRMARPM